MSKNTLIIGNWKMHLTVQEASLYVHTLESSVEFHRDVDVVIAPTMLCLQPLSLQINHHHMKLAAQNLYWRDDGAFTGEVSAHQLRGLVHYAIVGHSERRHVFGEHDKDIRAKVQAAIRNHITPVLCIGETAAEKSDGETMAVLHDQLVGGLANLTADEVENIVIAYEPVWALSSGKDFADHASATPSIVKDVVATIRKQVEHLYGKENAKKVRVLYGGSVNAHNAGGFLIVDELDGFLVGGASLQANDFNAIIQAAHGRRK